MSFLQDFKAFALKGNVVDLAVGVIIGGAFGKLVSALVADIIMPLVALLLPPGDWREQGWVLRQAADPKEAIVLRYGDFLGTMLDLLIISMSLFLVTSRLMRAVKGPAQAPGR